VRLKTLLSVPFEQKIYFARFHFYKAKIIKGHQKPVLSGGRRNGCTCSKVSFQINKVLDAFSESFIHLTTLLSKIAKKKT